MPNKDVPCNLQFALHLLAHIERGKSLFDGQTNLLLEAAKHSCAAQVFGCRLFWQVRHHKTRSDFAVLRPSGPAGLQALLDSFVLWEKHPPCHATKLNVDLIISVSRQDEDSELILAEIEKEMTRTNGWGGCFRDLLFLDSKIPEELDIYDESIQRYDRLWVYGPNFQFRSIIRDLFFLGKHESFFLMESDTYPLKDYWLDTLVDEAVSRKPFGVLGSEYQGTVWDDFVDLMPFALVHHMNGNAVYNLSSTLLRMFVQEMEDEQDTFYSAVPYDYRISQMISEAFFDVQSVFPFPEQVKNLNKTEVLPEKKGKLKSLWQKYHGDETFLVKSNVIGNYGAVKNILEDTKNFTLLHGVQYHPLKRKEYERKLSRNLQVDVCPPYAPDCLEEPPIIETEEESDTPSDFPSDMPSATPALPDVSTTSPTASPSASPTAVASNSPTMIASAAPTDVASAMPTPVASATPSVSPSTAPVAPPSTAPSSGPTLRPTIGTVEETFPPTISTEACPCDPGYGTYDPVEDWGGDVLCLPVCPSLGESAQSREDFATKGTGGPKCVPPSLAC